jgi:UDP-apiose/xylose synthase
LKPASGKTICLLGCAGFVGSHLTEQLLRDTEHRLIGVDLESSKIKHLLGNPRLRFVQGDAYAAGSLERLVKRSDLVIALTALCNPALYNTRPLEVIEENFTRPLAVAAACARYKKRLIYFSTSEVYGKTVQALDRRSRLDQTMREETTHFILGPVSKQRWTYACAKQLMERVVYAYGAEQGLNYTMVRPFNFIGPRMDYLPSVTGEGVPRVFACFMDALLFNKPLQVVDGGKVQRVFTAISDAVDALMRIIERPETCQRRVFNIGNPDNEVTIRSLAQRMLALYPQVAGRKPGKNSVIKNVTGEEFYGPGYDDSDRRVPDISLAKKLLGWQPHVGLTETLRAGMGAYVREYGNNQPNRVGWLL